MTSVVGDLFFILVTSKEGDHCLCSLMHQ